MPGKTGTGPDALDELERTVRSQHEALVAAMDAETGWEFATSGVTRQFDITLKTLMSLLGAREQLRITPPNSFIAAQKEREADLQRRLENRHNRAEWDDVLSNPESRQRILGLLKVLALASGTPESDRQDEPN